jgi:hypothetical protein
MRQLPRFSRLHRRFILTIFGFVLCLGLTACIGTSLVPSPYFERLIDLAHADGNIDMRMKIAEHRGYRFHLSFKYRADDQVDRARVRELTGGTVGDQKPGVPTPVEIKISRIENEQETVVYQNITDPVLSSWGADSLDKVIAAVILEPGIYRLQVRSLKSELKLLGTPIFLMVTYNPKLQPITSKK